MSLPSPVSTDTRRAGVGGGRAGRRLALVAAGALLGAGTVVAGGRPLPVEATAPPTSGGALAWGDNFLSELGYSTSPASLNPVPTPPAFSGPTALTAVSGGGGHSLAIGTGATVYEWGDRQGGFQENGTHAPLPDPSSTIATTPTPVSLPIGAVPAAIADGGYHHLVLTTAGQVLAWGDNGFGQLGHGTATGYPLTGSLVSPPDPLASTSPQPVIFPPNVTASAIAAGERHSLALTSDGLYAWGSNNSGQLGTTLGLPTVGSPPPPVPDVVAVDPNHAISSVPLRVNLPSGTSISTAPGSIAAGASHSLAVDSTGQAWAWGDNGHGQVGTAASDTTTPARVHLLDASGQPVQVTEVAAGGFQSLALSADGQVWAWGDNLYGELGSGAFDEGHGPVRVALPPGVTVKHVAAGYHHSLAIDSLGRLLAWGADDRGQLGRPPGTMCGPSPDSGDHAPLLPCDPTPTPVDLGAGKVAVAASAGGNDVSFQCSASGGCASPSHTLAVVAAGPVRPAVLVRASPSVLLGGQVSSSATLTGGASPTGSITFSLLGPGDVTCSGSAAFSSQSVVATGGPTASGPFTPSTAGTYRWIAEYSGDSHNAPSTSACNDPGSTVVVTPASVGQITPTQGSTTGGAIVTVGGTDLTGVTSVLFGGTAATAFTVLDDSTIQTTAPPGPAGPVDVTVTKPGGTSAASAADRFTYVVPSAGSYQGLQPNRICDTRRAQPSVAVNQCNGGGAGGSLGPGQTTDIQVCDGAGGSAACSLGAVTMNVAVTGATAPSYLTVYPAGATRPLASTINFLSGDTKSNLVEVKVGDGGKVTVYNAVGTVEVVIDLEGMTPAAGAVASTSPGLYHPLPPARVCDTRSTQQPQVPVNQCNASGGGAALSAGAMMSVQMTGQGGIPSTGVAAVVFNLTVTGTTRGSYMTAWPAANARPLAANLNWVPGQTVPNRVVVPVGHGGRVSLYNALGSTDVVVDVSGWYGDGTEGTPAGASFTGVVPSRICDSRVASVSGGVNQCNSGGQGAPIAQDQSITVQATGSGHPVPAGAVAVVANVTVTDTGSGSYLTVWPSDAARQTVADLNWAPGQTTGNLVVVKLSAGGAINLYNRLGTTDVVIDVVGYFS